MATSLCVGGRDAWRDALFDLLADVAEDCAFFAADAAGRVIHWNGGASRILGYADDEVRGRPPDAILTPEDLAAGVAERERLLAEETGRADASAGACGRAGRDSGR